MARHLLQVFSNLNRVCRPILDLVCVPLLQLPCQYFKNGTGSDSLGYRRLQWALPRNRRAEFVRYSAAAQEEVGIFAPPELPGCPNNTTFFPFCSDINPSGMNHRDVPAVVWLALIAIFRESGTARATPTRPAPEIFPMRPLSAWFSSERLAMSSFSFVFSSSSSFKHLTPDASIPLNLLFQTQ